MPNAAILIIDDHDVFRGGLRLLLTERVGAKVVLEARTLDEALNLMDTSLRLVTLDLRMPDVAGVEALSALREGWPSVPVMVISASEHREDILACLGAGAHGYAPKSLSAPELADAVRQVLSGRIYAPKALHNPQRAAAKALDQAAIGATQLTDRQRQVLDFLLTGASTKEIGRAMDLAEGTVKIHLAAIYRSLGVKSRAEAIAKLK